MTLSSPMNPRSVRLAPLAFSIAVHAAVVLVAGTGREGRMQHPTERATSIVFVQIPSPEPALPRDETRLANADTTAVSRALQGARRATEAKAETSPLVQSISAISVDPSPSPPSVEDHATDAKISLASLALPDRRPARDDDADHAPAYLSSPKPDYPEDARAEDEEGLVLLKVLVSSSGAPARIEVGRTSGSRSLDRAAVAGVQRWRFTPARRDHRDVEAWMEVPVRFVLR